MEAIGILGREVLQPRGLIGLGRDSLDHCGPEIAEVSTFLTPRLLLLLVVVVVVVPIIIQLRKQKLKLIPPTYVGPPSIHRPAQLRHSRPLHARQGPHGPHHRPYSLPPGSAHPCNNSRLLRERRRVVTGEGEQDGGD
jgi:hypothetical protein